MHVIKAKMTVRIDLFQRVIVISADNPKTRVSTPIVVHITAESK
jgi:hypothetical protein